MTHLCIGLAQEIDGISSHARIILTQRNNTPEVGIGCWDRRLGSRVGYGVRISRFSSWDRGLRMGWCDLGL